MKDWLNSKEEKLIFPQGITQNFKPLKKLYSEAGVRLEIIQKIKVS